MSDWDAAATVIAMLIVPALALVGLGTLLYLALCGLASAIRWIANRC